MVLFFLLQDEPSFVLQTETSLCFGERLKLKAKSLHKFGDAGDEIQWNVTRVGDRTGREQVDQNEVDNDSKSSHQVMSNKRCSTFI